MIRNTNGITLIALIITIIILLILAGISIITLTGENGLIFRAKNASDETIKGQILEEINLEILDEKLERENMKKEEALIVSLKNRLNNKEWIDENNILMYKENESGYENPENVFDNNVLIINTKYNFQIIIDVNNNSEIANIRNNVSNLPPEENNRKYLYKNGFDYTNITGGYEQTVQENYQGYYTGNSEFKLYKNFMRLYSAGSGCAYATSIYIDSKNYIKKDNYKNLVIDFKATSSDNYDRPLINLKDKNGNVLYSFNIPALESKERQYLKIPLSDITEEFKLHFETSSVYSSIVDFSIYNIFLTNETEFDNVTETAIPQGLDKLYLLQGTNEYEQYTGGYNKSVIRYYNNTCTGTSDIESNENCIVLNAISNGSGYGTNSDYVTSNFLNRGNYTKLNIELEGTNNDNYARPVITLFDINENNLYSYSLQPNSSLEKQTLQIDLTTINTNFRIRFGAGSVLRRNFN